ncbi:2-hydroxy-3-oxopropionate reductase [hydrothermal vent metagenome]|uniref:2-hydroxy-3-oxopropionate reductase n=1 Tax=hydrothermal vent metagenome TaxID=652676 RepID=A0A3B0V0K8_9ZZZZ
MSNSNNLVKLNKVIVYGLGAMGRPIARNLHEQNLLLGVKNRSNGVALGLINELNLEDFEDDAQLFAQADCVLICVSADDDLIEVVDGFKSLLRPGSVVIDCSTVSSDTAKKVAADLVKLGIRFMDAPVSGGVEGAKKGILSVMVGADFDTYKRADDLFRAIGSQVTYMGKVGQGQATKAVNQVLVAGVAQTVCEALAFAEKCKLPIEKVVEVLSSGAAGNWFLDKRGISMSKNEFEKGFKLSLLHKDLKIIQTSLNHMQADSQIVDQGLQEFGELMQNGYGDLDISALIKLKRKQLHNEENLEQNSNG